MLTLKHCRVTLFATLIVHGMGEYKIADRSPVQASISTSLR